jgi:hypothetical protein
MKTPVLILAASLASACAAENQTIDLGNGTFIQVHDGRVSVHSTPDASGSGSVMQSSSSRSGPEGGTITSVVTERNGQRVTRQIIVSKDGKVIVSDASDPSQKKEPRAPAPVAGGGWLGVHTVPLSDALRAQVDVPNGEGILVEFVAADGPAAKAGVLTNDILLSLNGTAITGVEPFREQLRNSKEGQSAELRCLRKGKPLTVTATLSTRPADAPPGGAVTTEAERLLKEMQFKNGIGRRSLVVVEEDGKTRVVETDVQRADPFELLLNDPNIPDELKAHLRKTQEQFRKSQPSPTDPKEGP